MQGAQAPVTPVTRLSPTVDITAVREVVAFQAAACAQSGSPLYGRILDGVVADLDAGGVSAELLRGRGDDPFGSALPLRFLGGVHRIVLDGRAPELAAFYPSVGGTDAGDPVPAFLLTLRRHREEIDRRIDDGVQTNEVGRSAVLVGGYAEVARRTDLPLRVLEVGSSAGLNLRWDHYAYVLGDGAVVGDPTSPVRFEGIWEGPPPPLPSRFEVAERRGCDRSPIDPTTPEGRLTLLAFVWPDQPDRIARLEAAIEVARRVPAVLDAAEAPAWVTAQLDEPRADVATVVAHSIVLQYLSPEARRRFRGAIEAAGARATHASPIAWLRMEPAGERAELRMTMWPLGEERVLATAGYHGRPVWWGDDGSG
jgi:hypothetical protein